MKRFVALLLVVVLALTCFAGCGKTEDSDKAYVQKNGKLVVGITIFEPMDYKESETSTEYIGFDADMAKEFAKYLNVDAEFVVLADWGKKAMELDTKGVDVVWNGMTITDEVKGLMGVSEPYCKNAQVVVMKSDIAAQYTTADSLKALTFAAENGSAGAEALDGLGIQYTAVTDQAMALMEVASGSVQACVVDLLMAGAMIGEGTSYPDLTTSVELAGEEYGVGFRKGSDLVDEFNTFWKQAYDDGTVVATAKKYGIDKNIIAK